eukprot:CAMPEP_0169461276 /NCGR_PEP_ID=MMETSP1042-20121227/18938_1 /TAXON_ID=464988 /ORGANISM="Hemiselmis andersenii, Strain CCMP1180" /LENGTH=63 /DNA_ID=CAMNT_0009573831 /DNA_START=105 /DNA_END=293 /DNA_ORIENTATION=+
MFQPQSCICLAAWGERGAFSRSAALRPPFIDPASATTASATTARMPAAWKVDLDTSIAKSRPF